MRKLKKIKHKEVKTLKQKLISVLHFFYFLLFAAFIGTGIWLYSSGFFGEKWDQTKTGFHSLMADAGFVVVLENVLVYDRQRTPVEDLRDAFLGDEDWFPEKPIPVTQIDIGKIKERVEELPWVKSVVINRQLPNLLEVHLTEREPLAIYQRNGKVNPLDTEGNIVETNTDGLEDLIVVVGEEAPAYTPALIKILEKNQSIYNKVLSATFVGNRRWNLMLEDNGKRISVLLPETEIDNALKRLNKINQRYHLFDRNISQIDLRLDDRTIIETINDKPIIPYTPKESEVK